MCGKFTMVFSMSDNLLCKPQVFDLTFVLSHSKPSLNLEGTQLLHNTAMAHGLTRRNQNENAALVYIMNSFA